MNAEVHRLADMGQWGGEPGVVTFPDGVKILGRSLRKAPPVPDPELGLYFGWRVRPKHPWPSASISWPDFWLPNDKRRAIEALREVHRRAADERVELACFGGKGRTGTALALIATFAGVSPREAVEWVRNNYNAKAVEMPWQRRWVESL